MNDWHLYFEIIVCLTIGTILAIWFLLGYLNSFIEASISIAICGLIVVFKFIINFLYILFKPIAVPLAWLWGIISLIWSISILRSLLFIGIAVGIFFFDHAYSLKFYEMDQTEFTKLMLFGETYWITNIAYTWIFLFACAGIIMLIRDVLGFLGYIFDFPIGITIKVNR